MPKSTSPPDSPLSSMHSSDDEGLLRPPKRIKVSASVASSIGAPDVDHMDDDDDDLDDADGTDDDDARARIVRHDRLSDVSSDTSGDVPSSPVSHVHHDEDDFQEQVSFCAWDGCGAGDLGDLDQLVLHIRNSHIENRQKRYTCEWVGCQRKGFPHASGYALRAHMRKHTREKPFLCYLPECNRSFTRSDALAKHMRTVHGTEALRPSDPVPKAHQTSTITTGKQSGSKLRIIIKRPPFADDHDADDDDGDSKRHFSPHELALPFPKLFRQCRRQLEFARREGDELEKECRRWETVYADLWREKEALLAQAVRSELEWHSDRQAAAAAVGNGGEEKEEGEVKRSIEVEAPV